MSQLDDPIKMPLNILWNDSYKNSPLQCHRGSLISFTLKEIKEINILSPAKIP